MRGGGHKQRRRSFCRRAECGRRRSRLQAVVGHGMISAQHRNLPEGGTAQRGDTGELGEQHHGSGGQGDEASGGAVTPNLAVATVASADGRCQAARALHCADADGKWLSARPALRCVRTSRCGARRVPVGRARPDTALQKRPFSVFGSTTVRVKRN